MKSEAEAAAPPGLGGHYCATLGSAEVLVGGGAQPQRVLWTDAGSSSAWLLTARCAAPPPGVAKALVVRACVHGARVAAEAEAVRAISALVKAVTAALPPSSPSEAPEAPEGQAASQAAAAAAAAEVAEAQIGVGGRPRARST